MTRPTHEPGKPWLRVYKDECVEDDSIVRMWNFGVHYYEDVPGHGRYHHTTAWGEATRHEDAMAAGGNALRRLITEEFPELLPEPEPEPVKEESKADERPFLTAGSHLASSERRTGSYTFGFGHGTTWV